MLLQSSSRIMLLLHLAAVLLQTIEAAPQPQQNNDIDKLKNELFSMNPNTNQLRTPQPAMQQDQAADIDKLVDCLISKCSTANDPQTIPVSPIKPPKPDTDQPNTSCKCVNYHMCQNNNQNGSGNNGSTEGDSEVDGYLLINPRIDLTPRDDARCPHFLEICCDSDRTRNESITPVPQEQRPNRAKGCGIRNVGGIDFSLIGANDKEAGFGEFPWTMALLHAGNKKYFCAGSLIHSRVVLTANHCLLGRKAESFVVRAGEWDTQTTKERLPYVERTVERVISHPKYNQRSLAYDFALVILSEGFSVSDHINTVCLPAQNSVPAGGTSCYSTGWGKDVFGAAGRFSTIIKRVPLPIVDFDDCLKKLRDPRRLGPRYVLDPSFLCAGGQLGIDTCEGDGGAPLVCPIGQAKENRYQQNGIVSWGLGCKNEIPAAYANIAFVRDWIDEEMRGNGFSIHSYTAL